MADNENLHTPEPHAAPASTLVDKIIDLALGLGGGAMTLMSGLLAAALILYSGYAIYDSLNIEQGAASNAWELLELKTEIFDEEETPLGLQTLEDTVEDYRAWLTVYGTNIDYPVVQGSDDVFYSSHDIFKNNSITGAIYLDSGNSSDFSDSYNVIYGHYMDSGAMFGSLKNMAGSETGLIVTPNEIYDVQFFAVLKTDAYEERIYNVGNRMDDVIDFLDSNGEGGVGIGTDILYYNKDLLGDDAYKIVALSTCERALTNERLVVLGRMDKRIIMKNITVSKIWDDNNDQDGIRPASLEVTASNGSTAVLNEDNSWTATISVPKFDNLGEITYTWYENDITGYEQTGNVTLGDETTITNRHIPEVTSVAVRKIWDDDNNRDGLQPESLKVILSNGEEVTLKAENNWTARITDLPKYENHGTLIEYTWTEETVTGYELTTEVSGDTTILKNKHTPETINVSVEKKWDDNQNQDGIQPDNITVSLHAGDKVIRTLKLDETNSWTETVPELLKYEAGQEINYYWTENDIAGYELTTSVTGMHTVLTNKHIPAVKSLTVRKIWDDNENQDGIRPRNLRVRLSNGDTVSLNEGNRWTATINNLPVYQSGVEIAYSWTEEDVDGYYLNGTAIDGNITILTNRHDTATTVATVVKVWEDDNNRDGIRPDNLTVTLSNGDQVTLSDENDWMETISGLPMNAGGQPITYTWTEDDVNDYTLESSVSGTTTTLTNTHSPAVKNATVKKVWEDDNDRDRVRPGSVMAILLANGNPVDTVELNIGNEWTATITGIPVNDQGQPIVYTWSEEDVAGYTMTAAEEENTTILTNTHEIATTSVTVKINWNDASDQDGIRPDQVTVTLSNGDTVVVTAEDGWTATIDNLPVYEEGELIKYTWTEEDIDGYTLTDTAIDGYTTVLTNTHVPAVKSLTVVKIWEDDNDRDRIRPSILRVNLLADGETVKTFSLNISNNWSAIAESVPVNKAGQEITYTWEEDELNGYTLTSEDADGVTTLTNTHEPQATELTVKKLWDDDDNRDGLRPETLIVTLLANEKTDQTVELNADNEWTATVSVPVLMEGRPITYEWTEPGIPGYTEAKETDGTDTLFTNTHAAETTDRTIRIIWFDNDNQDGIRPESLTVTLMAGGEAVQTVILNPANEWSYTISDLPVYSEGVQIIYSWAETVPNGYYRTNTTVNNRVTTLTNTHEPETIRLTVVKQWISDEEPDRPYAITMRLLSGTGNGRATTRYIMLTAAGGWTRTLNRLPRYEAGVEIQYVWSEVPVSGYKLISTKTEGILTVFTNEKATPLSGDAQTIQWGDCFE